MKQTRNRERKITARPQLRSSSGKWALTTPVVASRVAKAEPDRVRWLVDTVEAGRRSRKFFRKKAEAEGFVKLQKVRKENLGRRAETITATLAEQAEAAERMLEPFGVSLLDAVSDYVRSRDEAEGSQKVETIVADFIASRKAEEASDYYLRDLRLRLGKFSERFGDRPASSITRKDVEGWLDSLGVGAVTRANVLRNVKALFSWAEDREIIASNPAARVKVKKPKVEKAPEIFTPEEAEALLDAAQSEEAGGGKMVPYFALGIFAGIRPEELKRLRWEEIDLEGGFIEITAGKSKTAQRRLVDISPNLAEWLFAFPGVSGAVAPPNVTKLRRAAMKAAGIRRWPVDVMRHSFISYHLARGKDAAETALQAGHKGTDMIFRHYREIVKPKEAEAFWGIVPGVPAKKKKITRIA